MGVSLPDCCERHVARVKVVSPTTCKCGNVLIVRDRLWVVQS